MGKIMKRPLTYHTSSGMEANILSAMDRYWRAVELNKDKHIEVVETTNTPKVFHKAGYALANKDGKILR
jgi:hypothetical protein